MKQIKLVEIKKVALEMDAEDWKKLGSLSRDFDKICDSISCPACPLEKFCEKNGCPSDYLADLYNYLDD